MTALDAAIARASRRAGRQAGPGRVVGRRAAGGQHPRVGVHPAQVDPGAGGRPGPAAGGQLPAAAAERRRRVGPVPRRAGRPVGTVKGYFALKLMGDAPDAPHMARARELTRKLGGAEAVQHVHPVLLRLPGAGQLRQCPSIPPEVVFLPKRAYFNLYNVSAWTRTMILPLGIVTTLRPVRHLPGRVGHRRAVRRPGGGPHAGHAQAGAAADVAGRVPAPGPGAEDVRAGPDPRLRGRAMELAEAWLLERMADQRGARGHLPAHGLHADRAPAVPGVRRTTTRSWSRRTRT